MGGIVSLAALGVSGSLLAARLGGKGLHAGQFWARARETASNSSRVCQLALDDQTAEDSMGTSDFWPAESVQVSFAGKLYGRPHDFSDFASYDTRACSQPPASRRQTAAKE